MRPCRPRSAPATRRSPARASSSRSTSSVRFIGQPLVRKEDDRLVAGKGCFSDDVNLPGQLYACFVRSPHAHARILGFNLDKAKAVAGVVAILTGSDAVADGLKPIPCRAVTKNPHEVPIETRF